MKIAQILPLVVALSCSSGTAVPDAGADAPSDIPSVLPAHPRDQGVIPLADAPTCPTTGVIPPCVVEVVSFAEPAQIGARLCGSQPGRAIIAIATDSTSGAWGDVTKWAIQGWGYVEEMTDSDRGGTVPYARVATYDGHGGPISECASSGAPVMAIGTRSRSYQIVDAMRDDGTRKRSDVGQ